MFGTWHVKQAKIASAVQIAIAWDAFLQQCMFPNDLKVHQSSQRHCRHADGEIWSQTESRLSRSGHLNSRHSLAKSSALQWQARQVKAKPIAVRHTCNTVRILQTQR
jgi:hypothetical protein